MTTPPQEYRFRVTRARCGAFDLYVWCAAPYPVWRAVTFKAQWYGRRVVELPIGGVLAATWREAMAYANTGTAPRPIADMDKYRRWCGYGD